jgi:predicted RNase H-like nuclease (RuvC/YqgF family)
MPNELIITLIIIAVFGVIGFFVYKKVNKQKDLRDVLLKKRNESTQNDLKIQQLQRDVEAGNIRLNTLIEENVNLKNDIEPNLRDVGKFLNSRIDEANEILPQDYLKTKLNPDCSVCSLAEKVKLTVEAYELFPAVLNDYLESLKQIIETYEKKIQQQKIEINALTSRLQEITQEIYDVETANNDLSEAATGLYQLLDGTTLPNFEAQVKNLLQEIKAKEEQIESLNNAERYNNSILNRYTQNIYRYPIYA